MANSFFTFTPFDFNEVQGSYSPIEDFEMEEAMFKQRQDQYLFGIELGEAILLSPMNMVSNKNRQLRKEFSC